MKTFFNSLKEFFFNKKFPQSFLEDYPVRGAYFVSFVTFCFFFLLEPFNIRALLVLWKFVIAVVYSTIPVLLYTIVFLFFKKWIIKNRNKWTLGFELLLFVVVFFVSGCIVVGYSYILFDVLFRDTLYLSKDFFHDTISFIFIFSFLNYFSFKLFDLICLFKINSVDQDLFPVSSEERIHILSNNKNEEVLILEISSILFFESERNNLLVFYVENGEILKKVMKKSLKEIEDEFSFKGYKFYRCHKSFIINLYHIKEIRGNARTISVVLKHNVLIPVSRNKFIEIRELIGC